MRYRISVLTLIVGVALARDRNARGEDFTATADQAPAVIPADVQMAPLVPPSYAVPTAPWPYPNVQASWNDDATVAQPMPPPAQPTYEMPQSDVPWPRWTLDAAALIISRDNNSRSRPINPGLYATDPQFDAVGAPDIAIGHYVDPKNEWQLRYFNALGLEADAHTPAGSIPYLDLKYVSNLQNAEINYIHTWNYWSIVGGFRYINLDEHFYDHYFDSSGNLYNIYNFSGQNNLFGGQIGLNYHREWRWLVFDDTLKFGLYGNAASQHASEDYLGTTTTFVNNHPTGLADSLEMNLYLGHRFSPHWLGRIGLMVLTIDGVALAHDVEYTNRADGNVTLVGLSLGATAQW